MPELPEVEVTRLGLDPQLHGAVVRAVHLGKPLRWPLGCDPASLVGLRIGALQRRGKYLWMPLSGATRDGGLLWHLGMSGSLSLSPAPPPRGPHDHVELATSAGTLRLNDPRRFGAVQWAEGLDREPAARHLAKLGMEPFDPALDAKAMHGKLRGRRCSVKAMLLSGAVVVGAGNIYACEALFRSGIHPGTCCDRLSLARCQRLLDALRQVLRRAIAVGGSTLRDFRDVHGASGAFQSEALVYGREGEPCPQCGAAIRRLVQQQRSSFCCPRCQRR